MVIRRHLRQEKPENRWGVVVKDAFNTVARTPAEQKQMAAAVTKLVREVKSLIKSEGMQDKARIISTHKEAGYIVVACNDAFGRKLKKLPSADPEFTGKVHDYRMS